MSRTGDDTPTVEGAFIRIRALGHAVAECHAPHCLASLRGVQIAHGALSYTNAAAASDDARSAFGPFQW